MKYDFTAVHALMQDGVAQLIFPGAVLLVASQEALIFHQSFGLADLFSRRPMTCQTVFDLASLTKPLVTALSVMHLVRQGQIELDRPCVDYWPRLGHAGPTQQMTIRHLLSHSSGLPAWRPYYLRLTAQPAEQRLELLQQWIVSEPLTALPGEHIEYSDLGFLVLQWVVETVSGQSIDLLFQSEILQPQGIEDLFFNDFFRARSGSSHIYAATEFCPWRGRLLVGEVHDDNTHVIGGVAGHAGLFGTAAAVGALLQGLLCADQGMSRYPLYDRVLLRYFFQRQPHSTWALGFDTPAEQNSSAGRHFSAGSIGHLGYTGTSFWMDRVKGLIVILLTNRVHPCRYDYRIRAFRPMLHDAIMKEWNRCLG